MRWEVRGPGFRGLRKVFGVLFLVLPFDFAPFDCAPFDDAQDRQDRPAGSAGTQVPEAGQAGFGEETEAAKPSRKRERLRKRETDEEGLAADERG